MLGRAIEDGEFKFELEGEKLHGAFVLVRTAGFGRYRARPDGSRAKWLLIHRRDEHAIPGWDAEDEPRSVKTGRTNDEVAATPTRRFSATCLQRATRRPRAERTSRGLYGTRDPQDPRRKETCPWMPSLCSRKITPR